MTLTYQFGDNIMPVQYDALLKAFPNYLITTTIDAAVFHTIYADKYNVVYVCTDPDFFSVSGMDWDEYGDPTPSHLCTTWFTDDYHDSTSITHYAIQHITHLFNQQRQG